MLKKLKIFAKVLWILLLLEEGQNEGKRKERKKELSNFYIQASTIDSVTQMPISGICNLLQINVGTNEKLAAFFQELWT